MLTKKLEEAGKSQQEAEAAAIAALESIGLKIGKSDHATQYLLYLGESEIDRARDEILADWEALCPSDSGKGDSRVNTDLSRSLKRILDGGKAVDLGLFGRMLANLPEKNMDGACQVAHAISTNKVNVEFDFYTAVDDLRPQEEPGAGMMGTVEFNSACYYRYSNVDLGQLTNNLGGDEELCHRAAEAFVESSVNAIPTGKQNSFASPSLPDFVMAVVRDAGHWSLANAFAKPVQPNSTADLLQESIRKLVDYWRRLVKVYGAPGIRAVPVLALDASYLGALEGISKPGTTTYQQGDLHQVETMKLLIQEVLDTLRAGRVQGG
jgi:CRISPR system Cascade subunit CasC